MASFTSLATADAVKISFIYFAISKSDRQYKCSTGRYSKAAEAAVIALQSLGLMAISYCSVELQWVHAVTHIAYMPIYRPIALPAFKVPSTSLDNQYVSHAASINKLCGRPPQYAPPPAS